LKIHLTKTVFHYTADITLGSRINKSLFSDLKNIPYTFVHHTLTGHWIINPFSRYGSLYSSSCESMILKFVIVKSFIVLSGKNCIRLITMQ